MTPLNSDRWLNETDAFIRQFAERARDWNEFAGDLEDVVVELKPDPLDELLAAVFRRRCMHVPGPSPEDSWDSTTVLRARGRRLAKLITDDGAIVDYDQAKHFDLTEIPVDGLDELEVDLRRLSHQPDRCIVRGGIADLGRTIGVRRLLHPDDQDPAASLVEVPRRWLALDVDGLARPVNVPAADLVACAGIAIAALPAAFHDARCIVQATAGHGFKPGLRLRLWYWLDRPVGTAELKRWLPRELVDHTVFGAVQPIYTSAPVFTGQPDPLPERLIRLPHGTACVPVPDLPAPQPRPEPAPVRPSSGLSRYAEAALDNECRRIAAAGKGDLDRAVNSAAYRIGRLAGAGAIPPGFALRVLQHTVSQIPGYDPRRDAAKVERSFGNGVRNPREALHG